MLRMRAIKRLRQCAKGRSGVTLSFLAFVFFWAGPASGPAQAQDFSHLPVKGMVTLIDLGANQCVPCKLMAPILDKLQKDYKDKAAIAVIDVYQHNDQVQRFGIRAIPTQIFFDPSGKEVYRHVGFMSEKAIVEQLTKMGVK
jgi:thioredoxin 1